MKMNEQLQQALTEVLNKTVEATGKATDFLIAELPDVIQQLLMWKMAESLIVFVVSLAAIVAGPSMACYTWRKLDEYYHREKGKGNHRVEWLCPVSLFWLVLTLPGSLCINITWLQIWIAPKVYLLEYAASLAK
jgi:hypothetical protein